MERAKFQQTLSNLTARCNLCPNYCRIQNGSYGICRGRYNVDGVLYAVNYGKAVSIGVDPIEKKPLYHYYPGSNILSLGSNTCNLACDFCQNYTISQLEAKTFDITPKKLLDISIDYKVGSVAFTYSEPLTWYEFVFDSAKLLKANNIRVVLVTNGYLNTEPLQQLLPYIDAMNIDLKAMSDDFYQKITKGKLEPVLNNIKLSYKYCHLEITNLLIPGENDDTDSINKLVDFIADISPDIPVHFSRYYPQYKRSSPPTSSKTLSLARQQALNKLNYVYLGNILTEEEGNTYCPQCHSLLIERQNYNVIKFNINRNRCPNCNAYIYGKFE